MINMYVMQNSKKMLKWTQKIDENDWIKDQYDDEIALFIDDVKTNIKRHDVNRVNFIIVNIRFDKSNVKFISITLIVINKKQWHTKVENVLLQKWKRHMNYSLRITLEILSQIHNVDVDDIDAIKRRRDIQTVKNSTTSSRRRKIRTIRQKKQQQTRLNRNETIDDIIHKMTNNLKCESIACFNESDFCYKDFRDFHYSISENQLDVWLKVVTDRTNDVTKEQSSIKMWKHLFQTQESVKFESKFSITHFKRQENKIFLIDMLSTLERQQKLSLRREIDKSIKKFATVDESDTH